MTFSFSPLEVKVFSFMVVYSVGPSPADNAAVDVNVRNSMGGFYDDAIF